MKIFCLKKTQTLPININEAWAFMSNPNNLIKITPKKLNLVATNPLPETMHQGMIVIYRVKPILNIPMNWVTEITHMQAPSFFVDEQRFGPYAFWHHQHHLTPCAEGTRIDDIIHYAIQPNLLAKAINNLLVKKDLEDVFQYRFQKLKELFGSLH